MHFVRAIEASIRSAHGARGAKVTSFVSRVRGAVRHAACGVSLALGLGHAPAAHAEPLSGSLEVSAGAELLVLAATACEHAGDQVGCRSTTPFAGFTLAAHQQLAHLLALGVRLAGSTDLDATEHQNSDGRRTDRDLWLWRVSLEARISPGVFPRGLWLGAELGAALLSDSVDEYVGSAHSATDSRRHASALLGAALGWDFPLAASLLFGITVRGQWLSFGSLQAPRADVGRLDLPAWPYCSLDLHVGYRW